MLVLEVVKNNTLTLSTESLDLILVDLFYLSINVYIWKKKWFGSPNFTLIRKKSSYQRYITPWSNQAMHIVFEKIYSNDRKTGMYVAFMSSNLLEY